MKGFRHNRHCKTPRGREKLAKMWDLYVSRVVTPLPSNHEGGKDKEVSSVSCPYSKGH